MEALKNSVAQLIKQSENNVQRLYHIISAGTLVSSYPDFSKKIGVLLNMKNAPGTSLFSAVRSLLDLSKVNTTMSRAEKLLPPGRLFHLYKPDPATDKVVIEEADKELFTEIVISSDMVQHHYPFSYDAAWKGLMENQEFWEEELKELGTKITE